MTTRPCPECEGSGYFLETARVAGEAIDADQYEVRCDDCGGLGMIEAEPECDYCGDPIDAPGCCAMCEADSLATFPVIDLGDGTYRVEAP